MKLSGIISEANDVAEKYNLQLVEIDSTDNIISLKLLIDNDLFIQVYGNAQKDKLNLALAVIPLMLPMNMSLLMTGNLSETLFVNRWNSWKAGIYYRPDVPGSVRRI